MKCIDDIRQTIPDFAFEKIDRILSITLSEEVGEHLAILAVFRYVDGIEIEIRFIEVRQPSIAFHTHLMWFSDLLISYDDASEEYCFHDELGDCSWWCKGIQLVSIKA